MEQLLGDDMQLQHFDKLLLCADKQLLHQKKKLLLGEEGMQ